MAIVYHTYADENTFRGYMAGSNHVSDWTEDTSTIRNVLESVSYRINQFVGNRSFGPTTATHSYDIGLGALRTDAIQRTGVEYERPDYWGNKASGAGRIPLDNWLISPTTVTSYDDTARTSSNTLTEGTANDFLLEPYNRSPKNLLKLNEDTAKTFNGGQQTLTILGAWGWQDQKISVSTIDAIGSTTTTSVSVASGSSTYVGYTVLVDTEQMYITAVSGNNLTVIRGVNGTTAATHSGGATYYRYQYPADVVDTCLEVARNRWRSRDAGTSTLIGSPEQSMTTPQVNEQMLLRRLDYYVNELDHAGVYF